MFLRDVIIFASLLSQVYTAISLINLAHLICKSLTNQKNVWRLIEYLLWFVILKYKMYVGWITWNGLVDYIILDDLAHPCIW